MRKIRSAVAATVAAAGILAALLAAGTANASTYTLSFIDRCAGIGISPNIQFDCFQLGAYSTYTDSQVWINGRVICHPYRGTVNVTWCGVGGGNGTGALNIGDNFTFPHASGSYYERMQIFSGGAGCDTYGSNSTGGGIYQWFNDNGTPVCESRA
jgi:hypothetical protein